MRSKVEVRRRGVYEVLKPVSQSYAVAKSEQFLRATGQSNLADKRLAATKASKVLFLYSHNCTVANGAVFHSVCQVWLSRGPSEYFTFSYCAWLWNWLSYKRVECTSLLEREGTGSTILQLICLNCVYVIDRAEKLSDEKVSWVNRLLIVHITDETPRCDNWNESSWWVHSNDTTCVITEESSFWPLKWNLLMSTF